MHFLRKISSWKTLGILLVVYVLFVVFVMSGLMDGIDAKLKPLDLFFSYSPEKAYGLITSYGEHRERYAFMSMTADTAYPIIYTALFMVLILQLAKSLWPQHPKRHRIALIPLFAFVFDVCENASIITMLKAFPERLDNIATLSSLFTSLKWSSVAVVFAIILLLIIALTIKKLRA